MPSIATFIYLINAKLTQILIESPTSKDRFIRHRGDYLESEVNILFEKMFNNTKVYNYLYYNIFEDGEDKRCELDHLIIYDTNIFIIESKSGKFSDPARRGAFGSFKEEIRDNIEYAFKQAKRTKDYILSTENPTFYEANGEVADLNIDKHKILRWFLINTTLDDFGDVATKLNLLKDIGIYSYDEYPWSVNLNDLLKVFLFLNQPSQFVHYLHRRLVISNNENKTNVFAFYELDYLWHYLNHNIFFEEEKKAFIFLETGGKKLLNDALIKGEDITKYKQKMPKLLEKFLEGLEVIKTDGYTEVALNIYDLSMESRELLVKAYETSLEKYNVVKKPIESFIETDKVVFHYNVMSKEEYNYEQWRAKVYVRNYQLKNKKIISFLKFIESDKEHNCDKYLLIDKSEFKVDEEMEMLSKKIGLIPKVD